MRTKTKGALFLLSLSAALGPLASPRAARADERELKVVCTLPVLGAIAREVGGDRVTVRVLSGPSDDPHTVLPTPGLMSAVSEADLFIEVGMGLELWAERVLEGARNPKVRRGRPGHVLASEGVEALEVPAVLSRSEGDIHGQGNPHIWLDPLVARQVAANVARGLGRVDPAGREAYEAAAKRFSERVVVAYAGEDLVKLLGADLIARLAASGRLLSFLKERKWKGEPLAAKKGGWLARLAPLEGKRFLGYHRSWAYFARAFGLDESGQLEPKPGIPPTPGHLESLEALAKEQPIALVLFEPYLNRRTAEAFATRIGARAVEAPTEPAEGQGFFELFDALVSRVAGAEATR